MSNMPAVIVRKGGFLTALFHGVFGFLTVVVICATGLGIYGLHTADGTVGSLLSLTGNVVSGLPDWLQNLPPLLSESLDDHRAPDYRDQIEVSVRTVPSPGDSHRELALIEVENNGPETITVLALTVVLEDENGVPACETRTYAATPFALDEDEWRGPLLPGSKRRFMVGRYGHDDNLSATVEVAELRVWNGPRPAEARGPSSSVSDAGALATAKQD